MTSTSTAPTRDDSSRLGPFGRLLRFIRQVLDELRKVVRPTREELVESTAVVVGFIIVVMAFILACDQLFQRAIDWVFGGNA